jgi:hypothetical protein
MVFPVSGIHIPQFPLMSVVENNSVHTIATPTNELKNGRFSQHTSIRVVAFRVMAPGTVAGRYQHFQTAVLNKSSRHNFILEYWKTAKTLAIRI